ncbi:chromosome-associated kinesin KIF4-like isoform X1 [Neodiprion virginianus]|uniref:chromosome-associated kinesin KIF4-like isoform X1 n=1 Tax=Neodiprion virginianus TaxID=2961670 RepID=UPI001EE772A6|nr:chromosome-associated kinesin KIF4-like isoform X1 [Neodiprion virginianus]
MVDASVNVALRIRPLVQTEIEKGCQTCVATVRGQPQVQVLGTDKAFTFNHVFPPEVNQETFYNTAVKGMINNLFQGYNVTILAYGQTGSGKTHSMGTCYKGGSEELGIIPHAINDIFQIVEQQTDCNFEITVSFTELYQEQLYDLLSQKSRENSVVDIREDTQGIKIPGLTEIKVENATATFQCLSQGSLGRATGATAMNSQSSRSHAIFTVNIRQEKKDDVNSATTAKFHLVDLAGSERSKKTKATGERFKEGVNINKGLLALGNVISQLGDGTSGSYVGYRDSKLTRLLQDSLGGNSMTLIIACISPADYNLDETLSTLRYADRARRIKNKPIVNQDPHAAEVNRLNKLIQELRLALLSQGNTVNGENACPPEHKELQAKIQIMQVKNRDLTEQLHANLVEFLHMSERADLAESASETLRKNIADLLRDFKQSIDDFDANPNATEEHRSALKIIYNKILEFQSDQEKTAREILSHELSTEKQFVNHDSADTNFADENSDDTETGGVDLDIKQEEHTLQQAERKDEVKNINRELALKEELVAKLIANSTQMVEYSKEMQEMESEIKKLQAEKDDLQKVLVSVQSNNASSKLAETRRKKVQELEKKISELSRKCMQQGTVIKMKEKSEAKIKSLLTEIQSMKRYKVKLMQLMRSESEKFRQWKLTREQEVRKLKDQDRKRQHQIVRMETQHSKQQNVLKRKVEEACAINKRLKEALEKQSKAQQKRDKAGNTVGIQAWVTQELEVLTSTIDAERSLERLMQDRALLTTTLTKIKANKDKYDAATYAKQISELTEDLQLRSAQIADLQQKILASDQENKTKTRWNQIQTMIDAKCALKTLFDIAAEKSRSQYAKTYQYDELMEECDALRMKNRQMELQQKEQILKQREREAKLNAEHEEVVAQLLDQLRGVKPVAEPQLCNVSLKEKKPSTKEYPTPNAEHCEDYPFTDDSLLEDDVEKDPDWTKTPLFSRISKIMSSAAESRPNAGIIGSKRSSDGDIKCACKSKCHTRLCTCRKNDLACINCNCNPEICCNRDQENIRRTILFPDVTKDDSDDSFKKPIEMNTLPPKPKRSKLQDQTIEI